MSKKIRITPIENGTVIDHIQRGQALNVLKILKVGTPTEAIISIAMNAQSKRKDYKDIIMIEDRILLQKELDKIALIASDATINIIKNSKVIKKYKVKLPHTIKGLIRCPNPECISNVKMEPIESEFVMMKESLTQFQCSFCDKIINENDMVGVMELK